MAGKYRLYIDESGTHNYSKSESIGKRYLSLTGVIISEEENINMLQPAILAMRRLVADDPDDLPNLHREEIVNKSGPFSKLGNPAIEAEFNSIYLPIIRDMEYALCTVVLDKKSHLERYQGSAHHPYHYCMDLLLERYVLFLEERGGRG